MTIDGFNPEDVAHHEAAHGVLGCLSGARVKRCRIYWKDDHWEGRTTLDGSVTASIERVASCWAGYAYEVHAGRPGAPSGYEQANARPADPRAAEEAATGLWDLRKMKDPAQVQVVMREGWDRAIELVAEHVEWIERVAHRLLTADEDGISHEDIEAEG